MKKSSIIWIIILALLAVSLFLWTDQIASTVRSILPGFIQNLGYGNLTDELHEDTSGERADGQSSGQNVGLPDTNDGIDQIGQTDAKDIAENSNENDVESTIQTDAHLIYEEGITVQERILAPEGFARVALAEGSFGEYLRSLPLKAHGSKVTYYNGDIKPSDVHVAVLDIDVGSRDLQQCADSIIRLRAEYLYKKERYDRIHFNFTNGFNADYTKWIKGYRIKVAGNNAQWVEQGTRGTDYEGFRKYLDMVFSYAGTLSLSKEMKNIPLEQLKPGDIFLKGASPGHCVIILDMAENEETGETRFIIAQGYMPAQEMHILKNPANSEGNPWYSVDFGDELITPEWIFSSDQLYRFEE